ncbi:MAG: response regulator transcription factor [Saprospiraceae bacterium]
MVQSATCKILIADEHVVSREGLKAVLRRMPETADAAIMEAADGNSVLAFLKKQSFDLLILDVSLEEMDGLKVLEYLQQNHMHLPSIVFSRHDNQRLRKAVMIRGASGFVFKSQPLAELEKAVRTVLKGRRYSRPGREKKAPDQPETSSFSMPFMERASLTRREIQVLRLISQARSNKEIAAHLFISVETVCVHRKNLMRKLGVQNKASLIRAAYEFQLVE